VPAAEIEAPVIDQLRGIFRQPEIVVGTWRAARAEQDDITEDDVREALTQLNRSTRCGTSYPRPSRRGSCICWSSGSMCGCTGVEVRLRPNGLAGLVREIAGSRRAAA
jgi:site-specific DNA recombinase